MIVTINNELKTIVDKMTIAKLVFSLNISEKGMAIAIDGRIIRRESWETTRIEDGNNITIIRAAYGG